MDCEDQSVLILSVIPRPSHLHNTSLEVVFGLALTQIIDVDERNQVLTTNCWLSLTWQDHHLQVPPDSNIFQIL